MLDDYAFPSQTDQACPMSRRQYARLVDERIMASGLQREYDGTHSLRRTKVTIIYKQTGNLRAMPILLGHTEIVTMVRCPPAGVAEAQGSTFSAHPLAAAGVIRRSVARVTSRAARVRILPNRPRRT